MTDLHNSYCTRTSKIYSRNIFLMPQRIVRRGSVKCPTFFCKCAAPAMQIKKPIGSMLTYWRCGHPLYSEWAPSWGVFSDRMILLHVYPLQVTVSTFLAKYSTVIRSPSWMSSSNTVLSYFITSYSTVRFSFLRWRECECRLRSSELGQLVRLRMEWYSWVLINNEYRAGESWVGWHRGITPKLLVPIRRAPLNTARPTKTQNVGEYQQKERSSVMFFSGCSCCWRWWFVSVSGFTADGGGGRWGGSEDMRWLLT